MFLLSKSPNTAPELTISHLQDLGMIELRLLLCLSSLYSAPTNIQSVTGLFEFPNQTPYDTHLEINNHGFLWSPVTRPADYIGHLGCNYPQYPPPAQPRPSPLSAPEPDHKACLNTRYIQYLCAKPRHRPKSKFLLSYVTF